MLRSPATRSIRDARTARIWRGRCFIWKPARTARAVRTDGRTGQGHVPPRTVRERRLSARVARTHRGWHRVIPAIRGGGGCRPGRGGGHAVCGGRPWTRCSAPRAVSTSEADPTTLHLRYRVGCGAAGPGREAVLSSFMTPVDSCAPSRHKCDIPLGLMDTPSLSRTSPTSIEAEAKITESLREFRRASPPVCDVA